MCNSETGNNFISLGAKSIELCRRKGECNLLQRIQLALKLSKRSFFPEDQMNSSDYTFYLYTNRSRRIHACMRSDSTVPIKVTVCLCVYIYPVDTISLDRYIHDELTLRLVTLSTKKWK